MADRDDDLTDDLNDPQRAHEALKRAKKLQAQMSGPWFGMHAHLGSLQDQADEPRKSRIERMVDDAVTRTTVQVSDAVTEVMSEQLAEQFERGFQHVVGEMLGEIREEIRSGSGSAITSSPATMAFQGSSQSLQRIDVIPMVERHRDSDEGSFDRAFAADASARQMEGIIPEIPEVPQFERQPVHVGAGGFGGSVVGTESGMPPMPESPAPQGRSPLPLLQRMAPPERVDWPGEAVLGGGTGVAAEPAATEVPKGRQESRSGELPDFLKVQYFPEPGADRMSQPFTGAQAKQREQMLDLGGAIDDFGVEMAEFTETVVDSIRTLTRRINQMHRALQGEGSDIR